MCSQKNEIENGWLFLSIFIDLFRNSDAFFVRILQSIKSLLDGLAEFFFKNTKPSAAFLQTIAHSCAYCK